MDGFPVEWLKIVDSKIVLTKPEDLNKIGTHHAELKLLYPSDESIYQQERLLSSETVSTDSNENEEIDLTPWTDTVLDSNSFTVNVKFGQLFSSIIPEPEPVLEFRGIGNNMLSPWVIKAG